MMDNDSDDLVSSAHSISGENGSLGDPISHVQSGSTTNRSKVWLLIVSIALLMTVVSLPLLYLAGYANAKDKVHRYNIITTFASLPPLYAVLANLDHNESVYVYQERANTFDMDKMPLNWHKIRDFGLPSGEDSVAKVAKDTLKLVMDIDLANPQATFRYYVDDLRVLLPLFVFESAGISMDRVSIIILSDGTASYNSILNNFLGQDGLNNWQVALQELENYIFKFGSGQSLTSDDYYNMFLGYTMPLVASTLSNVTYWLQFPEYYYLNDNMSLEMLSKFLRLNLVKQQPYSLYNNLAINAKAVFMNATINNPSNNVGDQYLGDLLDEYFGDSSQPVMVISGTNPNPANFATDTVDRLIEMYGGQYKLLFKPHPSFIADNDKLLAKGIEVLPAQLPMEVLMMVYSDIKIGGFNGTLYMSTRSEQVAFFIGKLVSPLDWLVGYGFFDQAVFVD